METATRSIEIECQICDFKGDAAEGARHRQETQHLIRIVGERDAPAPQETPARQGLVGQVTKMLATEAYHYCSDCHGHCRQLILTVEALKESVRINRDPAFQKLVQAVEALRCHSCGNRIGWEGEHSKYGDYKKCSSCKSVREALRLAREGEK